MVKKTKSIINFYEKLPDEFKDKQQKNIGFEKHGISLPCRILISGMSGQGKTNAILNYLKHSSGMYDKITIITKANEPLYKYLKKKNKDAVEIIEIDKNTIIPDISHFDGTKQNFLILDDMITEKGKNMKIIEEMFIRGRKLEPYPLNMCFITQSYYHVPTMLRKNMTHLFIFQPSTKRELECIKRDIPALNDNNIWDELKYLNEHKKGNAPNSFINVDINKSGSRINFN